MAFAERDAEMKGVDARLSRLADDAKAVEVR